MDSFILYNNDCVENEISPLEAEASNTKIIKFNTEEANLEGQALWNMILDGVVVGFNPVQKLPTYEF